MSLKPTRKTRSKTAKHEVVDELPGLDLDSMDFPSLSAFKSTALSPRKASSVTLTPQTSSDEHLQQRLKVLELEKQKLELELQVAQLRVSPSYIAQGSADFGKKKKSVDWPGDFVPGALNKSFDLLDQFEFVAGYLLMIKSYDIDLKSSFLEILELLSIKAMNYSWSSVRSFYAYIASQVEQRRLNWNDIALIKDYSTTFFKHSDLKLSPFANKGQHQSSLSNSSAPTKNGNFSSKPCRFWNYKGVCQCDKDQSSYASLHVCRVCAKDHPMLHCPKRKQPIPEL